MGVEDGGNLWTCLYVFVDASRHHVLEEQKESKHNMGRPDDDAYQDRRPHVKSLQQQSGNHGQHLGTILDRRSRATADMVGQERRSSTRTAGLKKPKNPQWTESTKRINDVATPRDPEGQPDPGGR